MWWQWLYDAEVLSRPISCPKLKSAVENRTSGEPFAQGHLKLIHQEIDNGLNIQKKGVKPGGKLPTRTTSSFNKLLFAIFIELLEASGCRQHEIIDLRWSQVRAGETVANRKRVINTL
ncbi:MAG: hypothetical protein CL862_01315 [Cyanobium sp. NAT70]|nr:hypothetical protein [Cyanobium sp. NAT70]|tara:strand:- start:112 stop:465 length:354 start_codon:yes stop_codon:yes gene_type:complete